MWYLAMKRTSCFPSTTGLAWSFKLTCSRKIICFNQWRTVKISIFNCISTNCLWHTVYIYAHTHADRHPHTLILTHTHTLILTLTHSHTDTLTHLHTDTNRHTHSHCQYKTNLWKLLTWASTLALSISVLESAMSPLMAQPAIYQTLFSYLVS